MEFVTLKTFDSAIDAHLVRSGLSNKGIRSFIFDENIVTLNPLYNILVGGIKLKVVKDDLERARRVLAEMENSPFTDESNDTVVCPACASSSLYHGYKSMKGKAGILSAFLSLLLGTYPLYYKSVYKCKDCGCEFRPETQIPTHS